MSWAFSHKLDFYNFSEKFPFSLALPMLHSCPSYFFKLDQKSFRGSVTVKEMLYRKYRIFSAEPTACLVNPQG